MVLVLPLHNAVEEAAKEHADKNYVLIDDVIKDQKNVASVNICGITKQLTLAGVAAAKTTKTKQVGFVVVWNLKLLPAAGFKAGVGIS